MQKSEQLLAEILKRFKSNGRAQVSGYNTFGYLRDTPKSVYVTREAGKDTPISHKHILRGIDAYIKDPSLYEQGPSALREFGITHVTSPVYALLHLLSKKDFTESEESGSITPHITVRKSNTADIAGKEDYPASSKLKEIIRDLEKYPIKGSFKLKPDDILSRVCNIPDRNDYSGLYLFYDDKGNLIYVGISGRQSADGKIIHREDGLIGRFLTGKQFGDRRSKTLPIEIQKEGFAFIQVKWFVTYGDAHFDFPRPIEETIIRIYKLEHNGNRPKWNKKD